MPTATRSLSAEDARLQSERDAAHAEVQALKRTVRAFEAETTAMQGQMSSRVREYPEEFEGGDLRPKTKSDSAKLSEEIRARLRDGCPARPELEAAIERFHAADAELQGFRRRTVIDQLEENSESAAPAIERIVRALEELRAGCLDYAAAEERAKAIVIRTYPLNGQHLSVDPRPAEWLKLASQALETDVAPPRLTEMGAWKLGQIHE